MTRHCELIQVIRTVSLIGGGVAPDDPVREVTDYWAPDGTHLAHVDQLAENHAKEKP